jgi:glutamate-1-semialdehyde aminotransferase
MAPSAYEAGFISSMHMNEELDRTIEAAKRVLKNLG